MADHWKLIANLLGTPGIDEPEPEVAKPAAQPAAEAKPLKIASERLAAEDNEPTAADEREAEEEFDASFESSRRRPPPPAPAVRLEPAPVAEPAPDPKKPAKRRTSWEAIASMFNVAQDKSPAPAEATPATAAPSHPEAELSIFGGDSDSNDNPALDAMFPEAKRDVTDKDVGWGKPKPKRMVDDIGWGDEDIPSKSRSQDDEPENVLDVDLDDALAKDDDSPSEDSEEPSRGRRRRRRGRRGGRGRDGDSVAKSTDDADSDEDADKELSFNKVPAAWGDELDVDASDEWPEPDSFAIEDSDAAEVSARHPRRDSVEDADDESEGEAVRRSSRGRRGRSRGRDRSSDQPAERDVSRTPRTSEPVARRPRPDDSKFSEDDEPNGELPIEPRRETTSQSESGDSRRRGRRSRRSEPKDDRPPRDEARLDPVDDVNDDLVDDLGDDDDDSQTNKHRNIPTWLDALETIVQCNTENHKRNEGRSGGSRGGGRPRGGGRR